MNNLLLNIKDYILNDFGLVTNSREDQIINDFIATRKISSYSEFNPAFVQELINLLTINETYFFRDKNQLNFFKNNCQKIFFKNKKLNIWCIACSSGEEVYTISMITDQLNIPAEHRLIHGFDINTQHLEKAQSAIYSSWSFRGMDMFYIENYFNQINSDKYKIKDKIKENTFFHYFNIKSDLFSPLLIDQYGKPDIVFCRNVLMYFDKNIVSAISNKISELLHDDGFLISGIHEVPLFKSSKLKYSFVQDTYIIHKKNIPDPSFLKMRKNNYSVNNIKPKNTFIRANYHIKETDKSQKIPKVKIYENALDINNKSFTGLDYNQIIASIEQGNKNESSKLIREKINQDRNDFLLYYLESLNQYLAGDNQTSELYLKKALFLNSHSAILNYHYGNIYLSLNDKRKAMIHFKSADKMINTEQNNNYLKNISIDSTELKEAINIMINMLEVKENV